MPARDIVLAMIVVIAWGSNFTAMKLALEEVPALLFVAVRFAVLIPLIPLIPRPASWPAILAVGALINMGQFAFLFSGIEAGASAGLASLLLQAQAPFTIVLAAIFYKERVNGLQATGIALAVAGLALFGLSQGGNITPLALALILMGALCWACGNLVLRRLPRVNMLALFIWASLIPPLPMLGLSMAMEGTAPLTTLGAVSVAGWMAVAYVTVFSTILGYALWGTLLSRHPAAQVTPFALLIPVVGLATAAAVLGERVTALESLGIAVVLAGLALAVLGGRRGARGDG